MNSSFNELVDKSARKEELSAKERLLFLERRPIPSGKEWLALYWVWVTRFTLDLNAPLSARQLGFLKNRLSPALLEDLVVSLRNDIGIEPNPVEWWDVRKLLNRKQKIKRLRAQVLHENRNKQVVQEQRAVVAR